jgi:hypothetical protein
VEARRRELARGTAKKVSAAVRQVETALAQVHPTAVHELKDTHSVELSSVVTRRSEQQA